MLHWIQKRCMKCRPQDTAGLDGSIELGECMKTKSTKIQILGSLGLLSATIMWGFSFVVVKDSTDAISIWYLLSLRYLIAVISMLPIVLIRRKLITKEMIGQGVVIGLLLIVGHYFQTIGCKYTTAGKNAFITTFYVILVPLLGWGITKKRPDKKTFPAAFIALAGLALLSLQDNLTIQLGDILTFVCSVALAVHIIIVDRYTEKSDPLLLTFWQFFFANLFAWVIIGIIREPFPREIFEPQRALAMFYIGFFSNAVGVTIQIVCQKFTDPNVAAVILSMESVFGMLFSVLLLGEIFTGRMFLGCVCMLGAMLMSELKIGRD